MALVIAMVVAAPTVDAAAGTKTTVKKKATAKATPKAAVKPKSTPRTTTTMARSKAGVVNANTATIDELAAAFTKVGVPSADRWAIEVDEYRPYPADPTWGKLRHELGKYHPDPDVVERIISVLGV